MIRLITLLLCLGLFSPTTLAITDRDDILKWCTGSSAVASGRCIGFLLATEDALSLGPVEGVQACLPRDISLRDMYDVVLEWLPAHPDIETRTGLGLAALAFASRYPCPAAPEP